MPLRLPPELTYSAAMLAQQLRFFKHPKPLLERFGADFFRALPPRPGVYIMSGEAGRVLYVGQSGNLRVRLGTYRNANPDHVSRKTIRLVHAVRKIDWEECPTRARACVRENQLLREHRPKFNSMNTYPKAYCFIGVRVEAGELAFWVTTDQQDEELYGAFKRRSIQGYGALLRLLWAALNQPSSYVDFPHRLLSARPPFRFGFSLDKIEQRFGGRQMLRDLAELLSGVSAQLVHLLTQHLPRAERLSGFDRSLQATDLELLADFFKFGPERNCLLKRQHGISDRQIAQDRLDDLLALSRCHRCSH